MSTASSRTAPRRLISLTFSAHCCAQGEHLLHVLNTLGSRKVVLEAELREIDEDIAQNSAMSRKYGEEFFTEGSTRLAQSRVRTLIPARRSACYPNPGHAACAVGAGREAAEALRD